MAVLNTYLLSHVISNVKYKDHFGPAQLCVWAGHNRASRSHMLRQTSARGLGLGVSVLVLGVLTDGVGGMGLRVGVQWY